MSVSATRKERDNGTRSDARHGGFGDRADQGHRAVRHSVTGKKYIECVEMACCSSVYVLVCQRMLKFRATLALRTPLSCITRQPLPLVPRPRTTDYKPLLRHNVKNIDT